METRALPVPPFQALSPLPKHSKSGRSEEVELEGLISQQAPRSLSPSINPRLIGGSLVPDPTWREGFLLHAKLSHHQSCLIEAHTEWYSCHGGSCHGDSSAHAPEGVD
jgi:hypothetical protein